MNNTPLHFACNNGHLEVAKILLGNSICLTQKNKDGKTALDIAKDKTQKKIYRMIYEKMVSTLSTSETQIENVEEHREIKRMIFDKFEFEYSPEQKNCIVCYYDCDELPQGLSALLDFWLDQYLRSPSLHETLP